MARVKNIGGGPGDEDLRPPPRLSAEAKGKAKRLTTKKHKFAGANTERVAAVAAAVIEQVECCHGSPARTVMLEGRQITLDESHP